eukprot:CAMPEP_0174841320 /NCGR_PEP_ID=MMETSP1114-20130205/9238_1 /TAXON_ID=312471 /ORGANISM="Neobodo designis, Strain CCAP 1951/1" /LENGTH=336 /DNA_ID=CAMNT_0016075501 /DNA_START=93 /DNA_END=1103 /DNA_ORIENTATION=+
MPRVTAAVPPLDQVEERARPATTTAATARSGTGPLPELLSELLGASRHRHELESPGQSPHRRRRAANVGQPPKWTPQSARVMTDAEARMAELRDAVVRQLSTIQGVPDPTAVADVSPYAREVFATPQSSPRDDGRPRPPNSLPVGERIPKSKEFGKRVFEGGIPQPLPPASPHSHSRRFGKRMNIELEAKRRTLATAAVYMRKPDGESIFSERFDLLRRGILDVDAHKPCLRLPSASRDHRRDCIPGLPDPRRTAASPRSTTAQDALATSGGAPRPTPPTRSAGHVLEKATTPRDTRYMHTATGAVLQRDPRVLITDPAKAGRPLPQTVRTIANEH